LCHSERGHTSVDDEAETTSTTFCLVDSGNIPISETFRELTLPGGQRIHILNRQIFKAAIRAADDKLRELLRADRAARKES
jgi:uncharacterized membrane protein